MDKDLRLQLVLRVVDQALAPLKRVAAGSGALSDRLKAARDELRKLQGDNKNIDKFRGLARDIAINNNAMAGARTRTRELALAMKAADAPTKRLQREFATAQAEAKRLKDRSQALTAQQERLRREMIASGVPIQGMAQHQAALRSRMQQATNAVKAQTDALQAQAKKLQAVAALKAQHGRQMLHVGMVAGAGAAGMAGGRATARPVLATVDAFRQQEDAATQLRASMMQAGGVVPKEFEQIATLAQRLGDRLPGATADFYEMMTMLRRQGMSSQVILGGLGEAAAYLGVQLRMPVMAAAEFAAKMQDATRTAESDMMSLMDTIQRGFYLGVDSNNMLEGFTKLSPALSIIRKQGLAAVNELAPLLVMMDQTGMRGEAAGNSIRKVLQGAMNTSKIKKATDGKGVKFNFTDGKGEFGGLPKMFAELKKLAGLSTEKRLEIMKGIFGDDAETLQVLATLIDKGQAGYDEVLGKMQAQAALRERVDKQLMTLSNLWEAATGTFTNVLASVGESVAGDLKGLVEWLNQLNERLGAWVKANPALVRAITLTVAGFSALLTVGGALLLTFATIVGPMLVARFLFSRLAVGLFGARAAAWGLLPALRAVAVWVWALAKGGLLNLIGIFRSLGTVLMLVGRAALGLLFTPMGVALALLAAAAYLVWRNWDGIKGGLSILWQQITEGADRLWAKIVALKDRFVTAGADMMRGLASGITNGLAFARDAIVGAAQSVVAWFREKLGIHSPSRVFMALGQNIPEGAALGIQRGQPLLQAAALGMAALPALAAPAMGAPLAGAGANVAGGGSPISITINAAPGQDPQAIARAVAAELDRRERRGRERVRSQLSDIDG